MLFEFKFIDFNSMAVSSYENNFHQEVNLELLKAKKDQVELKPKEKLFGNYILGRSIGEGTFGKVKLGTHVPTKERVRIIE